MPPPRSKILSPEWEQAIEAFEQDAISRKVGKYKDVVGLLRDLGEKATALDLPFSQVNTDFVTEWVASRNWEEKSGRINRTKVESAIRRMRTLGYPFPEMNILFAFNGMPGMEAAAANLGAVTPVDTSLPASPEPLFADPAQDAPFEDPMSATPTDPSAPANPFAPPGVPAPMNPFAPMPEQNLPPPPPRAVPPPPVPVNRMAQAQAKLQEMKAAAPTTRAVDTVGAASAATKSLTIYRLADAGTPGIMPGKQIYIGTLDGREVMSADLEQYLATMVLPTQPRHPGVAFVQFRIMEHDQYGRPTGNYRDITLSAGHLTASGPGLAANDPMTAMMKQQLESLQKSLQENEAARKAVDNKYREEKDLSAMTELRRLHDQLTESRNSMQQMQQQLMFMMQGGRPGMMPMPGMPGLNGLPGMPFGMMPPPPPSTPIPAAPAGDDFAAKAFEGMATVVSKAFEAKNSGGMDPSMTLMLKMFEQMDANRREDRRDMMTLLDKLNARPAGPDPVVTILQSQLSEARADLRDIRDAKGVKSPLETVREVMELQRMLSPPRVDDDDEESDGFERVLDKGAAVLDKAAELMDKRKTAPATPAQQQAAQPQGSPRMPLEYAKHVSNMLKQAANNEPQGAVNSFFDLVESTRAADEGVQANMHGLISYFHQAETTHDLHAFMRGLADYAGIDRKQPPVKSAIIALTNIFARNYNAIHTALLQVPRELEDASPLPMPVQPGAPAPAPLPAPAQAAPAPVAAPNAEKQQQEEEDEDEEGNEDDDDADDADGEEDEAEESAQPNSAPPLPTEPPKAETASARFRAIMKLNGPPAQA